MTARYRLHGSTITIDGRQSHRGDIIELPDDVLPNVHMEPLDAAAWNAVSAADRKMPKSGFLENARNLVARSSVVTAAKRAAEVAIAEAELAELDRKAEAERAAARANVAPVWTLPGPPAPTEPKETAVYRLHAAMTNTAGDRIHYAGEVIEFCGVPNARMQPLNRAAWDAIERAGHFETAHLLRRNSSIAGCV
jgi:hypothetical protein